MPLRRLSYYPRVGESMYQLIKNKVMLKKNLFNLPQRWGTLLDGTECIKISFLFEKHQ